MANRQKAFLTLGKLIYPRVEDQRWPHLPLPLNAGQPRPQTFVQTQCQDAKGDMEWGGITGVWLWSWQKKEGRPFKHECPRTEQNAIWNKLGTTEDLKGGMWRFRWLRVKGFPERDKPRVFSGELGAKGIAENIRILHRKDPIVLISVSSILPDRTSFVNVL